MNTDRTRIGTEGFALCCLQLFVLHPCSSVARMSSLWLCGEFLLSSPAGWSQAGLRVVCYRATILPARGTTMLQVGFGVGDVTPDKGMQMPGGFFKREGKGVRDKLLAVACVVSDGDNTVALVGLDALFITRPTVEAARRTIQKETKIIG